MNLKELGARIRSRREKRSLKQQDIANALQVSPQAVSKWERGENAPDLAMLAPLARLLGVTVDWLISSPTEGANTFEATVFVSSVQGAYEKSLGLSPADFASWANGFFHQLTASVLRCDGVPIKYMGDAFLCFFSGVDHARRAVEAALLARRIVNEELRIGLASGQIFLGAVGHPDYARPDIMGETVNIAFLVMDWAEQNTESGIATAASLLRHQPDAPVGSSTDKVNFRGISHPVQLYEIKSNQERKE